MQIFLRMAKKEKITVQGTGINLQSSQRIVSLRFLLIIMVVFAHANVTEAAAHVSAIAIEEQVVGVATAILGTAPIDAVRTYAVELTTVHTITGDNGTEFADHQNIDKLLKTKFFFTNPYSSWEKGLIENTNKLIRQYIPKKSNFNELTPQIIKEIQYKINNRPRANLKFYSPKEIFYLNLQNYKVALTG